MDGLDRSAKAEAEWRTAHAATCRAAQALRDAERLEAVLFAEYAELVNPRFGRFMHKMIERQEHAAIAYSTDDE